VAVTWSDYELTNPPIASEASVRASEQALGVRLPADYLAIARIQQAVRPRLPW
jgi:hypothetical protein